MSKKMKVLITGANGFIGSHIFKHLTEKKYYSAAGLVRKTSDLFRIDPEKCTLVYGSFTEPSKEIVKEYDIIIHTAGKVDYWGTYIDFYKTNVQGTVNLLKTALEVGVKRFIYLSSTVVYGFEGNRNTREDSSARPFHNYYCTTKTLAEENVLSFKDRMEIIIFRPATVFGPLDTTFTYPLIREIEKGLIAFPVGGRMLTSPCYVKNLVYAVERALSTEDGLGEAYNISDGNDIPWIQFLSLIAEKIGKKPPHLSVPALPLYWIIVLTEQFYKVFKLKSTPLITSPLIAQVRKDFSFSISKVKNLLGYTPQYSTEEGLNESVHWYHEHSRSC
jgi:nucleoside-diphosphate-sugar epimerase